MWEASTGYTPEHILSNDVHKLQFGTDKEDDVFDISSRESATFECEHLFHFMFLQKKKNHKNSTP